MKCLRRTGGFTLVELIVAIAVGSMVTVAALSLLLLGLRMDNHSRQTITQQNATHVVMTLLEDVAAENELDTIITTADSWYLCRDLDDKPMEKSVIVGYSSASGAIQTGGKLTIANADAVADSCTYNGGAAVLKNVIASYANYDKDNNLLTVSVETEEGTYKTSVYCRLAPKTETSEVVEEILEELESAGTPDGDDDPTSDADETNLARLEFLKRAVSQLDSKGTILEIVNLNGETKFLSAGKYYAQWYNPTWPKETAWCACFVVWALSDDKWDYTDEGPQLLKEGSENQESEINGSKLNKNDYALAHVDGFIAYLRDHYRTQCGISNESESPVGWHPYKMIRTASGYEIEPPAYKPEQGDLIFFDWTVNGTYDCDHVGIVLTVVDDYIYTIEGNTADIVAVRKYRIDDPRVMGFGVLDWKTNGEMTPPPDNE